MKLVRNPRRWRQGTGTYLFVIWTHTYRVIWRRAGKLHTDCCIGSALQTCEKLIYYLLYGTLSCIDTSFRLITARSSFLARCFLSKNAYSIFYNIINSIFFNLFKADNFFWWITPFLSSVQKQYLTLSAMAVDLFPTRGK